MLFVPLDRNHFCICQTKYLQVNINSSGLKTCCINRKWSPILHWNNIHWNKTYVVFAKVLNDFSGSTACFSSHPMLVWKVYGSRAKWQFCFPSETQMLTGIIVVVENGVCFAYQYFSKYRVCVLICRPSIMPNIKNQFVSKLHRVFPASPVLLQSKAQT